MNKYRDEYPLTEDGVVAFVRDRDWVSCVELANRFGKGDILFRSSADEHVIMDFGYSDDLADVMERIIGKRIWPHAGSYLAYLIDGGGLRLPIVKKLPKAGYKKDHWLPIQYRVEPIPDKPRKRMAERAGA